MLTLLVPILIRFLLEPSQMKNSSRFTIQLHEHALNWLMRVGPKYPQVGWVFSYAHFKLAKIILLKQEFKALMTQAPELRVKLETTVRNQQTANLQKTAAEDEDENKTNLQPQQPTIKLKTKFDL